MIEPVGFFTIFVGCICLSIGHRAAAAALIVSTLLGSAAALLIGSATIQPAHLFLFFVALASLSRRREAEAAIRALTPPAPGFWLFCMVAYGCLGGILYPRLFAGITNIYPIGTSEYAATNSTVPLGPTSGNLTQSVYLIADLLCFALVVSIASDRRGFYCIANSIIAYALANIMFAFLDVLTYSTGTQDILSFIRNAQYSLHLEEQVGDIKRIAGSFTESSAFAQATLGALGFTATLCLCGYRPLYTGLIALLSFFLLLASTSSTGLAGIPPLLLILYFTAIRKCGVSSGKWISSFLVLVGPLIFAIMILLVAISDDASNFVINYLDQLIFNKSQTESGIERSAWNAAAIRNFTETWGLGVGLGTTRASSLVFAILSNLGLPGAICYTIFFGYILFYGSKHRDNDAQDICLASRNACLGLIIAQILSGALVDQGLIFYVYAGLAASNPEGFNALKNKI